MKYRFAKERQDYSDYASGRVFYSVPGHPVFPIRLGSEIFQRCVAVRRSNGLVGPSVVFDPCCGGAYHLSTLAYHHWDAIDAIIGSDVDGEALSLAERNLALLTINGMDRRVAEISRMLASYNKSSHKAALKSARVLRERLLKLTSTRQIKFHLFCADASDGRILGEKLQDRQVDIVITNIPYGQHSAWHVSATTQKSEQEPPLWRVLEALRIVVSEQTIIAIAANKQQRISHDAYSRIEKFRVGKRQVVLLRPSHPRV
jgi:hypothetical protein